MISNLQFELNLFKLLAKHLSLAFCFCTVPGVLFGQNMVVDDAVLNRFNSAKLNILAHAKSVMTSSSTTDYLNCDGYKDLLALDDKVIPLMIRELVQFENSNTIYGKKHYQPIPANDKMWLERVQSERMKIQDKTIPRFICHATLANTTAGKSAQRTGYDGTNETYQWLKWWKENKNRYTLVFEDSENFDIDKIDYGEALPLHPKCKMTGELLDVVAVGSSWLEILQYVAKETGMKVIVCHDENISMSVSYRGLTFNEFAFALAHDPLYIKLQKQGDTYYFGICSEAQMPK